MKHTKKDRRLLRKAWLAHPENKRLWLVFANALLEDNDEERWMEYPVTTATILLDHMVEQDAVSILLTNQPRVSARFDAWTRNTTEHTPNAIVRFLAREVWRKSRRELREVVFKVYNPKYIEDVGVAISHLLKGRSLVSCHYGGWNADVDIYNGVSKDDVEAEEITIADMVEWGPFALLK